MWLFNKIEYTQILEEYDGISEDEELMNYAAGHMMGGFEGMVQADILNQNNGAQTKFLIKYKNGKEKGVVVLNSSLEYKTYYRYLK